MAARLEKTYGLNSEGASDIAAKRDNNTPVVKVVVFVLALLPLAAMILAAFFDNLGANPVESIIAETGTWSLRILLISLALTPIRMLTGLSTINKFRRMLGLFAFFYCSVHFAVCIVLEHSANLVFIVEDIFASQIVQVGLIAYIMLVPLALTSTQAMIRRLGKNWKKLHNLVHVIAIFAILHYVLLVKADFTEPLIYGVILFVLQFIRGVYRRYRSMVR